MIQKQYSIYTSKHDDFEPMSKALLEQIDPGNRVIKIVFFGSPKNNDEYTRRLQLLEQYIKNYFPDGAPVISYISQRPHRGGLSAEVVSLATDAPVDVRYGRNYLVLDDGSCRELLTGGVLSPDMDASIRDQSDAIFDQLADLLDKENFSIDSIVRQWNYIENITGVESGRQHYQDFNDARSQFYGRVKWEGGYPAATGIGTDCGGVMVEIIAFEGEGFIDHALDNPLQIAAHKYSQKVLVGRKNGLVDHSTTPKFERARVLGIPQRQIILISGTAAIKGENSVVSADVVEQARCTMENIDHLISNENYPVKNTLRAYSFLRIYVKNYEHMEEVNQYMEEHYPGIKKVFLCADICREELLLEIEGYAEICAKGMKVEDGCCVESDNM